MKIKYERLELATIALRKYFFDEGIEICSHLAGASVEFGVNWPGKGTKGPAETTAFANSLLKASELCSKLNELDLEVDWADDDLDLDRDEVIRGLISGIEGNAFVSLVKIMAGK